jgi:hypothetical protein
LTDTAAPKEKKKKTETDDVLVHSDLLSMIIDAPDYFDAGELPEAADEAVSSLLHDDEAQETSHERLLQHNLLTSSSSSSSNNKESDNPAAASSSLP